MSLKAVQFGTRRSSRALVTLSRRGFEARPAKECHPAALGIKTKFVYDDIQPVRDETKKTFGGDGSGASPIERFDNLYHHYGQTPEWNDHHCYGYYGPYWLPHLGLHHHFIKRRLNKPGVYEQKNPIMRWVRQWEDNRGIDWTWPHGQYQHVLFKWILWLWAFKQLVGLKGTLSNHSALAAPAEPEQVMSYDYNRAYYQYIVEGVEAIPKTY